MIRNTDVQKKHSGERIRNSVCTVLVCAALFLAQSCRNVIHELIPPSDNGIHSFSVENADRMRYVAAETDSTDITITVPAGTDVTALLPIIESGDKSTVLPVTLPYIHRAFPSADLMSLAVQMNASQKAGDLGNWMLNFIRENKDFSVPPLDEPVDFTQPVMFCVIAGRGNYKLYTVTVVPEKPENPAEPDTPSPSEPDNPDEPGTPDEPSVPPQTECEKKILSFVVNEPKQTKPSVITEDTVTFYLNAGADSSAIYPVITVSEGAGILPLTQEYLLRLFSYTEMISLYSGYSTATDINAFISNTVKKLDADKIAKIMEADLSLPIDFSGLNSLFGVPFAVVGADKSVHIYSISGSTAEDTAALIAFAVTKIRNPGLMGDADVSFSGDAVTITATYPVEYQNFRLIPDIVIEGDTWEITGGTLRAEDVGASGEETECTAGLKKAVYLVPGDAYPVEKEYTATLTVRRGEAAASYTLRLIYKEDKDTIRSITDFRFLRLRNPGIKTTSMASISKNEDTGFISAAVMYEGDEPPYDLVADFYSPGTCTVEHTVQESGKSRNSFRYDVQILCTSKNKLFCRLYTVHVTFIKVKTAEAVLNYFAFPKHLNPDLSQSAMGLIDESSGTVYVNAKYHTPEKPAHLVPEFAATGTVSVNSILQSSGYSTQDFSRSVWYSVRDQNDWSSDSRTYRISVNWEQDEQSACAITGFGFSTADNPSLEKDISARINERAGTIYALLPKDAGKSSLAPYFSAKGTVTIGDAEQTSGSSRQDFSDEVVYTVTSANGLYTKQYAVSVQEAGPVIYVNAAAIGRNNGTCWQDAYITLDAAFEQAQAYGDAHKEIWIAYNGGEAYAPLSDAYRTNGLPLTANTTVRGGFDGTETDADERRTKKRSIEFDVNAVEDAKSGKMKTIPVRHEADVCEVQTKLCMPDDCTSFYFFRSSATSGEIVFDGIELEQQKHLYENRCFYSEKTDESSVIFSDCTVRCIRLTNDSTCNWRVSIDNSELYIALSYAQSITASGSTFKSLYVKAGYYAGLTFNTDDPILLEKCVFQNEPGHHFGLDLDSDYEVLINSCFFDNADLSCNYTHLENCLYSISSEYASKKFSPAEITCCELKNISEQRKEISFYRQSNATITDSNIEGFDLSPTSASLSVTNSMFRESSFDEPAGTCEIEMIGTTMEKTGKCLLRTQNQSDASITLRLKDCTFSDFNDGSGSYRNQYICLQSKNSDIDIDKCTFNIQTSLLYAYSNSTKIKDSTYLCTSEITDNIISTSGKVEITGNTFENKERIRILLDNSGNQSGVEQETVFTGNKLKGEYTILNAHNVKDLKNNRYENFVMYDIHLQDNAHPIDFLTETIEIKTPLYCDDNTPCTKKAYLSLSNGEIRIDDKRYKDFFCGLHLYNASAIVKGQEFGKIPKILKYYLISGSNSMLELTDCIIESDTTDTAISLKGRLTVEDSVITGSITNAESITAQNSKINGSIINEASKSVIQLKNTPVSGYLSVYKDSEITMTADSGRNDISIGTGTSNGLYNSIQFMDTKYSNDLPTTFGTGTVSLTNINVSGSIWGGKKSSIIDSTINGSIYNGEETHIKNSTVKRVNSNNILLEGVMVTDTVSHYPNFTLTAKAYNSKRTVIKNVQSGTLTLTDTDAEIISYPSSGTTIENCHVGRLIGGRIEKIDISKSTVGSIDIAKSTVTLINCTFNGNGQEQTYPAVRIGEQGYTNGDTAEALIVDNCSFSNYILNNSGASYVGGAAISVQAKTVQIKNNCRFSNCTNKNGNSLGGAINIEADTVEIDSTHFTGNTATYWRGGAVGIKAEKVLINDCTFTGNKTLETYNRHAGGGAVAITCSQDNVIAGISGCTFSSNSNAVENYGTDVWMSAEFVKGDTEEIESSYSGCTLTISSCTTDKSSDSLYKNNIDVFGSITIR